MTKKVCAHDEKTRSRALLAYDQDFQPMKLLFKTSKLVDRCLIIYAPRPRLCHLRAARLRMSDFFRYVMFITHFICASSQM